MGANRWTVAFAAWQVLPARPQTHKVAQPRGKPFLVVCSGISLYQSDRQDWYAALTPTLVTRCAYHYTSVRSLTYPKIMSYAN